MSIVSNLLNIKCNLEDDAGILFKKRRWCYWKSILVSKCQCFSNGDNIWKKMQNEPRILKHSVRDNAEWLLLRPDTLHCVSGRNHRICHWHHFFSAHFSGLGLCKPTKLTGFTSKCIFLSAPWRNFPFSKVAHFHIAGIFHSAICLSTCESLREKNMF